MQPENDAGGTEKEEAGGEPTSATPERRTQRGGEIEQGGGMIQSPRAVGTGKQLPRKASEAEGVATASGAAVNKASETGPLQGGSGGDKDMIVYILKCCSPLRTRPRVLQAGRSPTRQRATAIGGGDRGEAHSRVPDKLRRGRSEAQPA